MIALLLVVGATLASLLSTMAVRRYAIARAIVDYPNDRSLHDHPVPRGGGVAVVGTFLLGVVLLTALGLMPYRVALALGLGGAAVAMVGWLDDRSGIRPSIRALVHLLAAVWAVSWLGGLEELSLGAVQVRLGPAGSVLACIGIVWWINLYNFMDGIDGLAGAQALTVPVFASLLARRMDGGALDYAALLLAGSVAGFLVLNWAPARVFLGDVGSGFLGFVFAGLAITSEKAGSLPLVLWLVLSAVFLLDATVTLLRRVFRGERWYVAHRNHAYQRLVTSGFSHAEVTSMLVLLNVLLGLCGLWAVEEGGMVGAAMAAFLIVAAGYLLVEMRAPMPPRASDGSRAQSRNLEA